MRVIVLSACAFVLSCGSDPAGEGGDGGEPDVVSEVVEDAVEDVAEDVEPEPDVEDTVDAPDDIAPDPGADEPEIQRGDPDPGKPPEPPKAIFSHTAIDFGSVTAGKQAVRQMNLANEGGQPLVVIEAKITGDAGFGIDLELPLELAVGESKLVGVSYEPEVNTPAEALLKFTTNDVSGEVALTANQSVACLKITPEALHFGGKLVGDPALLPIELVSCGQVDLIIKGMVFAEGAHPAFSLDLSPLDGFDDESPPGSTNPLVLSPGEHALINVEYGPTVASGEGADGQPILDTAQLVFPANTFVGDETVTVDGFGVTQPCPIAQGVVSPALEMEPLSTIYLFGDQSSSDDLPVSQWKWNLDQPGGSISTLTPSNSFPNPSLQADLAGEYHVTLTVWDEAGVQSCVPWKETVHVKPAALVYVELLWATPNDPDETDVGKGKGSDLDLHFAHPAKATGGPDIDGDGFGDPWFHLPYDTFWFNDHPDWGSFDEAIADDPILLRTDNDGAGPESLAFDLPEGVQYRIGVHHWDDYGFGAAVATLRVWIDGELTWEQSGTTLEPQAMWDAVILDGDTLEVTPVKNAQGTAKVTPDYVNPFFFAP